MTRELSCDEIQFEISDRLDTGEPLSDEARAHVAACGACAAFARSARALDGLLPAGADAVQNSARKNAKQHPRRLGALAAAAAVALSAAGALWFGLAERRETAPPRELAADGNGPMVHPEKWRTLFTDPLRREASALTADARRAAEELRAYLPRITEPKARKAKKPSG